MSGHSGRCFRARRRTERRKRLQRERFARWQAAKRKRPVSEVQVWLPNIGRYGVPRSVAYVGDLFKQMLAENFR